MVKRSVAALSVLLLAGCAASEPAEPVKPLRFAVIAGPAIGGPPVVVDGEELGREDLLLEAVTVLSLEPELDVVLVPGPLLLGVEGEDWGEATGALVGALGSLAAPVVVAPGPDDGPEVELLEALERGLPDHGGEAAYALEPVRGWVPLAVGPAGALPDGVDAGPRLAVAAEGVAPRRGAAIQVTSGDAVALRSGADGVEVVVPPLPRSPHLVALGRIEKGLLHLELRALLGGDAPPPPEPVEVGP